MNTELKNAVLATDLKAQYDACAKKLLGYKDILARILIEAVEEFRGMSPEEVKPLISMASLLPVTCHEILLLPLSKFAPVYLCIQAAFWHRHHTVL